jgi:TetR/AcrR family transcriptional regulator, regulator of biofilm formation and stress response
MYQKGEQRREAILRATLRVIGARGADAVTHRAVAAEAGVPLSATTYYFGSKEALLQEALSLAAREETERLERVVLDLATRSLSAREWAQAVASVVGASVRDDPGTQVALFELGLESTRTPALREDLSEWQAAHLRLAEMGCRAVGSDEPGLDATVIVATIAGLMLHQLASDLPGFEDRVLRPSLERLFGRIASADHAPVAA